MAYMTNREFAELEFRRQKRNEYVSALIKEVRRLREELTASQRREKAAVEDLTKLATKAITPCHSCAKTCVFLASLAPECQPPTWCREWQWRGQQEAEKGAEKGGTA